MKIRYLFLFLILLCILVYSFVSFEENKRTTQYNNQIVKMKNMLNDNNVFKNYTSNNESNSSLMLHGKAACVYDTKGKRFLYDTHSNEKMPMASTTKIMTCIIAIESGYLDEDIVFSSYAASMPNVQLHASKNEKFKLKDILYSLMLESHNDVAAAIAENIAAKKLNLDIEVDNIEKSKELVNKFATFMNKKAKELGALNTNFVTPNGLDATNHYTTAQDLAKIAAYAINNNEFLKITNTKYYSLVSTEGKTYNLNNKNSFLSMYKGAIGCKTGYTSKAGYCFVGAINQDNYKLVSVILASGWPPNKNYKWQDTIKLMDYAINNYEPKTFLVNNKTLRISNIKVLEGTNNNVNVHINENVKLLINKQDNFKYKVILPKYLYAPIKKNQTLGVCKVYLNNELYKSFSIKSVEVVKRKTFNFYIKYIIKSVFYSKILP